MRIGAGRWKNALLPDAGPAARPIPARLRTSLFSVLAPRIDGASVLDLCAGVGGLGLEALSRGANRLVLVDNDRRAVDALARWIVSRGVSSEAVAVLADARRGGWAPGPFDLVFLDPPYALWDDPADALLLLDRAAESLAQGGLLAVKGPAAYPLPDTPRLKVLSRRAQGTVAYTLLVPSAPFPGQEGQPPRRLE